MNIKTLTLAMLLAATPAFGYAATPSASSVQTTLTATDDGYSLDKFGELDGVECMTLDKALLAMATQMGGDVNLGNGIEGDILKTIDKVTVATGSSKEFITLAEADITTLKASTIYKLVFNSNEDDEKTVLFTRGNDDTITEILAFSIEKDECDVVKIEGQFTPETLQSIIKKNKE